MKLSKLLFITGVLLLTACQAEQMPEESGTVSIEIKSGQRIYQEKPDFTRVTDVVECCQTHWKLLRVQHVCNRCATKISVIIIGHFSVKRFAGKCPFLLPESP